MFQQRFFRRGPLALALLAAFGLPAQAQTLQEVTVNGAQDEGYSPASSRSATKTSAPLRDIPQSVQVVPAQLLRDQGARSMEDALRNVPGAGTFYAGENGNTSTGDAIYMRGFDTSNSIYVDGVRDVGSISRDVFNTEQVEVTKGPDAAPE